MTLLWFEGFETIHASGGLLIAITEYATATSQTTKQGRLGLGVALASGNWKSKSVAEKPQDNFFGIGLQPETGGLRSSLTLYDSADQVHCQLVVFQGVGTNTIRFGLFAGDTVTTPFLESLDQTLDSGEFWHYVQFRVFLSTDATVGFAEMIVDAQAVVTTNNVVTSAVGTTCDTFEITATSTTAADDFYWCSSAGPAPYNTHLGPVKTEAVFPNINGTAIGWTPKSQLNFTEVNDGAGTNTDITWVSATANGVTDLLGFDNLTYLGTSPKILSVKAHTSARLEATGAQNFNILHRGVSTTSASPTFTVNDTSYSGQTHKWDVNPETTNEWTPAEIDAAEFGYETTA